MPVACYNTGGATGTVSLRVALDEYDQNADPTVAPGRCGESAGLAMALSNTKKAFAQDWTDITVSTPPTRDLGLFSLESTNTNVAGGLIMADGTRRYDGAGIKPGLSVYAILRWRT
jgi:hypothetical protein